jgi:hypothetical protein
MRTVSILGIVILAINFSSLAAPSETATRPAADLRQYIDVLTSDSLEGREVGTIGEWRAAQFIANEFKSAGLKPAGSDGYLQPFEFTKRIEFGSKCRLTINGTPLELNIDFVPLQFSGSLQFEFNEIVPVGYGICTHDNTYNDYRDKNVDGKAVLVKRYEPESDTNSQIDFSKYSSFPDKIRCALERNAKGIFFVTPSGDDDTLMDFGVLHAAPKQIPIIFVKRRALEKLGIKLDSPNFKAASGETELIPVKDTGYNVLGLLQGQSDTSIVLGAHFDHLGWGGPASRDTSPKPAIHRGADDNGSGTAALLELAHQFAKSPTHHSLLFAAFSGEEAGVLGSNYYSRHWTIDSSKIRMMLNMDMIGRLKDQQHGLAIFGVGTAAEFKPYFDSLQVDSMKLAFLDPGTGPSDHVAFYTSGIPVLHFFTGPHLDYHKSSDTPDKLDFDGIARVAGLASRVVRHVDSLSKPLTFQKTSGSDEGKRRAEYKVTLGVMPDYATQAKGLAVGGVTPDRPAEKAGVQKGDVIIRLGAIPVEDIYTYMAALAKFNKGDTSTVVVIRATDTLSMQVTF